MAVDKDEKQFFKDVAATAEQTVEEVRGFEENYFAIVQKTMMPFPWLGDLNKKLQSHAEQHFAACLEFSHRLSQAKDFQEFAQIEIEFFHERARSFVQQAGDFSEACSKSAANMIRAPFNLSSPSGSLGCTPGSVRTGYLQQTRWSTWTNRTLVIVSAI